MAQAVPLQRVQILSRGLVGTGNSTDVIATMCGLIVGRHVECYILPVNVDGSFTIEVAKDRLSAWVHLRSARPAGRNPSFESVGAAAKNVVLKLSVRIAKVFILLLFLEPKFHI